jgi:8-oxo-dGTP pyrophosphatase MutT (NUDIX family)
MERDCGFIEGNKRFRYRTGGFVIHDGKMLFVKSEVGNYYYMIGGGVRLGETSAQCIERELREEAGIKAHVDHLAVVCENFFVGDGVFTGLDSHVLEFYYVMAIDNLSRLRTETDLGEKLEWIPLEDISKYNIKPSIIKERFNEILSCDKPLHLIA